MLTHHSAYRRTCMLKGSSRVAALVFVYACSRRDGAFGMAWVGDAPTDPSIDLLRPQSIYAYRY
jgi:hypothetical protein